MALVKPLKVASGITREFASDDYVQNVAVGGAMPPGQSASYPATYVSSGQQLAPAHYHVANAYFDGANWKFIGTGRAATLNVGSGLMEFYNSASGTAGNNVTFTKRLSLKDTGELVANPSYINVKAYGALGNGSDDDTAEIQAAIDDAAALGMRHVYFPQGTYVITSPGLVISGDMMLVGAGPSASILQANDGSIVVSFSGTLGNLDNDKLTVMHLGFRSNSSSGNIAIFGRWTTTATGLVAAQPSCLIYDVEIGSSGSSTAFEYGVVLDCAPHGQIEKLTYYGIKSGAASSSSAAVSLDYYGYVYRNAWATSTLYYVGDRVLQSNVVYRCLTQHTSGTFATDLAAGKWMQSNTTDFKIKDCTFHYAGYGIVGYDCEGIHVSHNTFLSCLHGVLFYARSTVGKPYFDITNNHFNVGKYGVYLLNVVQFVVGDNLIYGDQNTPNSDTTFNGVRIDSYALASGVELQGIVRNNLVLMVAEVGGGYTTANYGYSVVDTGSSGAVESVLFTGNKSQGCDTLIYLGSNTTKVVIDDTNIGTSGETWSDNGSGNSLPYGKYSPTGATGTNCDAANVYGDVLWERTGDIVTVIGQVDADPTSTAASYQFFIPLPVASALTSATQLSGVLSPSGANAPGGAFVADTTNDRAECNVYSPVGTPIRYSFMFRYPVV